ncbi:MAG TPA: 5-methyltetrahydropteroyltriglutamate--homocysteine S-methyltransferase [Moraxellaceae bacterium]|nr:5-methyltetrahydropteroyltriglutamate--homocysteine S-methyltransferase [Moraxellaceae bacterium]
MMKAHVLGFPRIGADRELKKALEAYWAGNTSLADLEQVGQELRARHWAQQAESGLDVVTVGDFAFYDQMLATSALLGVVPERFGPVTGEVDLDTQFRMARGRAPTGADTVAQEMTKWFDTNYHYLVPELTADQSFRIGSTRLFDEVREAQAQGHTVKVVLTGPLTYLWLGKCAGDEFQKIDLLPGLLPVYADILTQLAALGVEWVQIDEPILSLDLPVIWQAAFESVYNRLQRRDINILIANYYGPLADNLWLACHLPVAGLHIDVTRSGGEWQQVVDRLPEYKVLSLGVIDGRNIWRANLREKITLLKEAKARMGDRLWVGSSCSLQHVPVDLVREKALSTELRSWLSFAVQKLDEIAVLKAALQHPDDSHVIAALRGADLASASRKDAANWKNTAVQVRVAALNAGDAERASPYAIREARQAESLQLPALPTTTIGSFPQTAEIRQARAMLKAGTLSASAYEAAMKTEIAYAVREQEVLGLDVLVHGEAERNDMVEYFGEQLSGFAFTQHGWVQSYGSRCVKPPVIVGDVSRPKPMTVKWAEYAQSLTSRYMKGMLTGPVTILCWSFLRDDVSRETVALQLALAVRDEVCDLEDAGIRIIQIDEPAFREGLPLRKRDQADYWRWAVRAFRVSASGVKDSTQIHTHMCYSEFNDCIAHIAAMDADVITIETARSAMELLRAFEQFDYPNAIGPGVYDIHSPRVPTVEAMVHLLRVAASRIQMHRLWVNPDCGLKTRGWPETRDALAAMVGAARVVREQPMQSSNKDRDEQAVVQPVSSHHAGCCTVDEV